MCLCGDLGRLYFFLFFLCLLPIVLGIIRNRLISFHQINLTLGIPYMEMASVLHLPGGTSFGVLLMEMELMAIERTDLHEILSMIPPGQGGC